MTNSPSETSKNVPFWKAGLSLELEDMLCDRFACDGVAAPRRRTPSRQRTLKETGRQRSGKSRMSLVFQKAKFASKVDST